MFQLLDKLVQVEDLRAEAGLLVLSWPSLADFEAFLVVILTLREEAGVSFGAKRARNVVWVVILLPLLITLAVGRSPTQAQFADLGMVLLGLARVLIHVSNGRAPVP